MYVESLALIFFINLEQTTLTQVVEDEDQFVAKFCMLLHLCDELFEDL